MRYIKSTIEEFTEFVIKNDKKIILFGAGAVCKTFIPYISNKYHLSKRIIYVIDNDPSKQDCFIDFNGNRVLVVNIEILRECKEDYCVLITNGEFYSVMTQLDLIEECRSRCCFIAAYMQLDRQYDKSINRIYRDYGETKIPKIIHYCWFSGKPIPESLMKCIRTWKEKCPDYEIIQWDESNFDLCKYKYTKEAAELQKWGYIPDIVRLEKLYEIGGFYFDTDVEILKNLDELRYQDAFCSRERVGHINFGGGSGSIPHNEIIKEILDFRKDIDFSLGNGKFNAEASGYFETAILMKYGLEVEDKNQKLKGINIYASEFFSPYNYINGEDIRSENTFSIHHFRGSWLAAGDQLRKETREKYESIKDRLEELE